MPRHDNKKAQGAIALLKGQHEVVKELFKQFEKAEGRKRKELADEAIHDLKVHAAIEEELFYPALRKAMEDDGGVMDEADEEHHVAKVLIAELEMMDGKEDNFEAKFRVLAENVRHHIREEEGQMFPKAAKTRVDFVALGERMRERAESLLIEGFPEGVEVEMVHKTGLPEASPAKLAEATIEVPMLSGRR